MHAHDEIWLQSLHLTKNCSQIKHTHARAFTDTSNNKKRSKEKQIVFIHKFNI